MHASRVLVRQRRAALALTAAVTSAKAALAREQLQGVFEGAVGYTDNVFSSPDEPVPDVPAKEGDLLVIASPSVVYAVATAPALHRASYTVTGNFFVTTASGNSIANRAEYTGVFDLTPELDLTLGAGATQNQYHTSNNYVASTATTLRSLFPGTDTYILLRADEVLNFDLGEAWRVWQGTGAGYQTPLFVEADTRTFTFRNRAGVEYTWREDALGPEARVDYSSVTDAVGPDGEFIGDQRILTAGGVLRWRHDWTRDLTSRVEAGGVHVSLLDRDGAGNYAVGGASIFYARPRGDAELAYERSVATGLLLGQTYLANEVRLRGTIPIDVDEQVWLGASAGYQWSNLIDPDGSLATRVDVVLADVGVLWKLHDHLNLSARYQFIRQDSEAELPPLPLSFTRNVATVGVRLMWPSDEDMPAPYRAPERVDRADEVRFGSETPSEAGVMLP